MTKSRKRLWLGLVAMALCSPLGLVLPRMFRSGDAWGEWDADSLGAVLGYIPAGLREYAGLWKAPVADYLFGDQKASFGVEVLSYAVSGLIGLLLVGMAVYLLSKALVKHER